MECYRERNMKCEMCIMMKREKSRDGYGWPLAEIERNGTVQRGMERGIKNL